MANVPALNPCTGDHEIDIYCLLILYSQFTYPMTRNRGDFLKFMHFHYKTSLQLRVGQEPLPRAWGHDVYNFGTIYRILRTLYDNTYFGCINSGFQRNTAHFLCY